MAGGYFIVSRKKAAAAVLLLSIADLFFATQLNLPVTVIGARSFQSTVNLLNRNPEYFPLPGTTSIEENSRHSLDSTQSFGSRLPYEKRIGRNDYYITPGNLASQEQFYESGIMAAVFRNPPVYFADTILEQPPAAGIMLPSSFAVIPGIGPQPALARDRAASVVLTRLSANSMECQVQSNSTQTLVYLQNKYPGWKAFIDGHQVPVMTANTSFMAIRVPAGQHAIVWTYQPVLLIFAAYLSFFSLVLAGFCILLFTRNRGILS
jgi:hypothetical protein